MGWTRQEVLEVARSTGMPVVEAWSSHNAGQMGTVVGPMLHHTGSTWTYPTNTAPTLRTVREGRSDLQNALCMYYIDYAGVIYSITEKIAWHAGGGSWQGVTDGNGHFAGIEAESDGKQWTKATVASYKHLATAILRKTGRTVAYAPRHADYALPKGRKTDFSGMDPATFLADVNAELAGATPAPILPPPPSGDDMRLVAIPSKAVYKVTEYDVSLEPGIYRMGAIAKGWGVDVTQVSLEEFLDIKADVEDRRARLLADVAKASGGDIDEVALGKAVVNGLLPQLTAALSAKTGATREDVEQVVRGVFADAAS